MEVLLKDYIDAECALVRFVNSTDGRNLVVLLQLLEQQGKAPASFEEVIGLINSFAVGSYEVEQLTRA